MASLQSSRVTHTIYCFRKTVFSKYQRFGASKPCGTLINPLLILNGVSALFPDQQINNKF